MAKKKTADTTAQADAPVKEKKVRPKREPKDSYLKDNYTVINDYRDEKGTGVRTLAMHVRGCGVQVREEAYQDGKLVGVSSNHFPGVKIKSKKDWKYLIIDKGPKKKKGSEDETEEDDE